MRRMRMLLILPAVTIAAALSGCDGTGLWPNRKQPEPTSPVVTTRSEAPAATKKPVMAYVNGQAIYMDTLHEILVRSNGMQIAQQLVSTELVLQEAKKRKITITEEDVLKENDLALKQVFGEAPAPDQRERLLQQFFLRFKVTHQQWELTMRRNAYLAKLAEPQITVSQEELRDEFSRRYGRSVEVRHIQTASLEAAQRVRTEAMKPGADFAKLAFRYSTNESGKSGGLLPAISKNTPGVLPAIRRAALTMKNVGEISEPIMAGTTFHILKLEKIIPVKDVEFADEKEKLTATVREGKAMMLKQKILLDLFKKAKIEYADPILKSQAEKEPEP